MDIQTNIPLFAKQAQIKNYFEISDGQLLNEILAVLQTIKGDTEKLEILHDFMVNEFYDEPEQEVIPKKYKDVLREIADSLLAGFVCFFKPETLEVEDFPEIMIDDPQEFESQTGESVNDEEFKHKNWKKYVTIRKMDSHESFRVMEKFADEVKDSRFQDKLIDALNRRKPFANFKNIVDNSIYREDWFDFRLEEWKRYVWNEIKFNEQPAS